MQYKGKWYRYLTSEFDPEWLPPLYVVALYWPRWRIALPVDDVLERRNVIL